MTRLSPAVVALVTAATLVVAGLAIFAGRSGEKHLTADFPSTTNLYPGAEVKVLGVGVGSVDSVAVHGTRVHVEISYNGSRPLPADVHAMIVPPSIVGDRFVQLTPPYTGGPVLPDGARLDAAHTAVPVELDEAYDSLNKLAQSLGPDGANADGALSRLLTEAAANLRGNGQATHETIQQLSSALDTLAISREDVAGTITNLGSITRSLAANDGQVRKFIGNLATVSGELNGQREELKGAVNNLNTALADIARFVRDNRQGLTSNISDLAQVTGTVAAHQRDLAEMLDVAPVGVTNLWDLVAPVNYDPSRPGAVAADGRTTVVAARPGGLIPNLPTHLGYLLGGLCSPLPPGQQQQLAPLCDALQRAGGDFGEVLAQAATQGPATNAGPPTVAGLLLGGHR